MAEGPSLEIKKIGKVTLKLQFYTHSFPPNYVSRRNFIIKRKGQRYKNNNKLNKITAQTLTHKK